jgi:anti-sigma factor (TIGR02949 family)
MTSEQDSPDCASVSGLIQPYVDGEVSDTEREGVLAHLDGCVSCRTTVQQQQSVRSALRGLERDLAPAALRERLLAELDRIDAEQARAGGEGWLAGISGRIGAFMRGGMLLAPAAAAAVGLFFVVRANVDSEQLATQSTSLVERADTPASDAPVPVGDDDESAKHATKLEPVEGAFEMQFAEESSLPSGIQLVGAGNATVRFRHDGTGFVDQQRPAHGVRPSGKEQVFRGRPYYLSRDGDGRASVQFERGGVLHELTWDGPTGRVGAPVQLDEADLRGLVELGDRLQSMHGR